MVPGLRNPKRGAQTWELSQMRGSRAVGAFEAEGPSRLHRVLLSKVLLRWVPSVLALHIHFATLVASGLGGWQFIAPIISSSPSSFFSMGNWHFSQP